MAGSMASPNSWSPYNNYKDCSSGICSLYCPQWCYIVFPPPPPFSSGDNSVTNLSPLIISVIGILASAFLLIAYYTLITKYCKRRRPTTNEVHHEPPEPSADLSHIHHHQDQQQGPGPASAGLAQSLIESITVCCYRKEDGLVEGTPECAVCLSEFQENEKLRLLPKCSHAFHVPCIDMWLKSHSNCPMCRANVVPQPDLIVQSSSSFDVSLLRVEPRRDLVVVVEDPETGCRTEAVVECRENHLQEDFEKLRLQIFRHQRNLLVSDILRISEEEEEEEEGICREIHGLSVESGSSRGLGDQEHGMEPEGSMSPGRFSSTSRHDDDKGKNLVVPD